MWRNKIEKQRNVEGEREGKKKKEGKKEGKNDRVKKGGKK